MTSGQIVRVPQPTLDQYIPAGTELHELVTGWLKRCKKDRTREAYWGDFVLWGKFCQEAGIYILDVTTDDITDYMRRCERTLTPKGKLPEASTVARRIATLSSFYRYCKRRKAIPENPVDDTERPDVDYDNSTTAGMTHDEAQRLIRAGEQFVAVAPNNRVRKAAARDAAIIAVMLCTGGRISEITAARIEHLGYDRGHRVLWVKRKGGKRQSIALGAAAAVVDRHVAIDGRTSGLIFQTSTDRPVDRAHIFRVIRKAALAATLPCARQLTPHSLRHTFATLALDAGAELSEVQDAMGHADPRTTRRYDRARNRIDRSPVHAVSRSLLGGGQ